MSSQLPLIGITLGDPVGIGPEIIIKALSDASVYGFCRPVVFGDRALLQREIDCLHSRLTIEPVASPAGLSFRHDTLYLFEASCLAPERAAYGTPTPETGKAMASFILRAVSCAREQSIAAMVTAPISKKSLQEAGYDYPGHTEMLARLTSAGDVVMMLAGDRLKVVLVTIHCSISMVPALLTVDAIIKTITLTHKALRTYFGLEHPRIAVAALNPHAGEEGLFGQEEELIIAPAIKRAQALGIAASGPFPADALFYQAAQGRFDVVVCMYHDQGLIPLKLLHFDDAVNITLGLPIIRTSVDHGTAYDIAGKGIANPASMLSALKAAAHMASVSCSR
ncbi:MAG: 4-hydroxythreonine-4-phosphate dehydrogenase PdxA [Pseudomonadota bacterium]